MCWPVTASFPLCNAITIYISRVVFVGISIYLLISLNVLWPCHPPLFYPNKKRGGLKGQEKFEPKLLLFNECFKIEQMNCQLLTSIFSDFNLLLHMLNYLGHIPTSKSVHISWVFIEVFRKKQLLLVQKNADSWKFDTFSLNSILLVENSHRNRSTSMTITVYDFFLAVWFKKNTFFISTRWLVMCF